MKKLFNKIKELKKKIESNKPISICITIIKVILYVLLISLLLVIIVQKVTKNDLSIGGIRIYTIATGSMKPEYQIGDIVISKSTSASELKVGDDVTYMGNSGDFSGKIVTHRIKAKRQKDGKYYFVTRGIANNIDDPEIDDTQIYGKVIYKTILFSAFGRIMNNIISYYVIFIIVALMVSYQIVKIIYDDEEEIEDEKE